MASDRKVCTDLQPLIRSRCKGVLKQDNEWKGELSCVTYAEFGGDWNSWSEFTAFSLVDLLGHFAGVPNLGKPLYREKTVYIKTHRTAINRPMDDTEET